MAYCDLFQKGLNVLDVAENILDTMYIPYFAGWFKKSGVITNKKCFIKSERKELIEFLQKKINIPSEIVNSDNICILTYHGSNALEFLQVLYPGEEFYLHFTENELLKEPLTNYPTCNFKKHMENAVTPIKTNTSDVGYDLTIVAIKKVINSKCTLYTTGISIDIEHGWYTEIVPRSSIIKSGYMLANSIGIIENSYRGELMIALVKIDDEAEPIELPFKCCQLLIKKQHYARMREVDNLDNSQTLRGDGGFGSTNI